MYHNRAANYLTPRDNQSHGHSCRRAFPDKICRHVCQESAFISHFYKRVSRKSGSSGNPRKHRFEFSMRPEKQGENRFLSSSGHATIFSPHSKKRLPPIDKIATDYIQT